MFSAHVSIKTAVQIQQQNTDIIVYEISPNLTCRTNILATKSPCFSACAKRRRCLLSLNMPFLLSQYCFHYTDKNAIKLKTQSCTASKIYLHFYVEFVQIQRRIYFLRFSVTQWQLENIVLCFHDTHVIKQRQQNKIRNYYRIILYRYIKYTNRYVYLNRRFVSNTLKKCFFLKLRY